MKFLVVVTPPSIYHLHLLSPTQMLTCTSVEKISLGQRQRKREEVTAKYGDVDGTPHDCQMGARSAFKAAVTMVSVAAVRGV